MGPSTRSKPRIKDLKLNKRDTKLQKSPKIMTTSSLTQTLLRGLSPVVFAWDSQALRASFFGVSFELLIRLFQTIKNGLTIERTQLKTTSYRLRCLFFRTKVYIILAELDCKKNFHRSRHFPIMSVPKLSNFILIISTQSKGSPRLVYKSSIYNDWEDEWAKKRSEYL